MRLHGVSRRMVVLIAVLSASCGNRGDEVRAEKGASAGPDTAAARAAAAEARQAYAALMLLPMQRRSAEAVEGLRALDETALSEGQARIRACMLERFGSEAAESPAAGAAAWPDSLVAAYQRYWRRALLASPGSGEEAAARRELFDETRALAGDAGESARSLDALEPHLLARLEEHGLHAQLGVTPPLRELMIWRTQTSRRERVDIPSGTEEVVVELMSDFVSRGWSHYATCGRSSAGGWVGTDRLFAMADRYDLDSEEYRVSYLAHEAQHFRDQREFAGSDSLVSWRLEYRAKLAQLAMGDSTRAANLRTFLADRSGDPSFPHSYANARVIEDLEAALLPGGTRSAEALLDLPGIRVREAAIRLVEEDSRALASRVPGRL